MSKIALDISIWSITIPLFVGFVNFKILNQNSLIVYYLILLASIPQLLTIGFLRTSTLNLIYNVYTPIEFGFIFYLMSRNIYISLLRKLLIAISFLFVFLSLYLIASTGINGRFLYEWVCYANLCYFCYCILIIFQNLINEKDLLHYDMPMFWFLSGLLLYTPCTFFVFALYPFIYKSDNIIIKNLWIIHNIFNTVLYIFYAVGLYKNEKGVLKSGFQIEN